MVACAAKSIEHKLNVVGGVISILWNGHTRNVIGSVIGIRYDHSQCPTAGMVGEADILILRSLMGEIIIAITEKIPT